MYYQKILDNAMLIHQVNHLLRLRETHLQRLRLNGLPSVGVAFVRVFFGKRLLSLGV